MEQEQEPDTVIHIPNEEHEIYFEEMPPLQEDATELADLYIMSNSPMGSNYGSDIEEDMSGGCGGGGSGSGSGSSCIMKRYKKLSPVDAEKLIKQYYTPETTIHPCTEKDVLLSYLRGMIILHQYSYSITRTKQFVATTLLVGMMAYLAILTPFVNCQEWGKYMISAGNAFAGGLMLNMVYVRLDVANFQHLLLSNFFTKMESQLESVNEYTASSPEHMAEVDKKIRETLEFTMRISWPSQAIRVFPILHNANIFQAFRKIDNYQKHLLCQFCDIKNEIASIQSRKKDETTSAARNQRENHRLLYLMKYKERVKSELLLHRDAYNQLDKLFMCEIQYAETHKFMFAWGGWFKPQYDVEKLSPVIRDYLRITLRD